MADGHLDFEVPLPDDLEERCISRFDELVAEEAIFYSPSIPEIAEDQGHEVEFRIVSSLSRKPMVPGDELSPSLNGAIEEEIEEYKAEHAGADPASPPPPSAPTKKPFNPFLDPDPRVVICPVAASSPHTANSTSSARGTDPSHRLVMNKYCVTRPMLLITTVPFLSQSDDLNIEDLRASWSVLMKLGRGYMCTYNCGRHSGNSQPHKHMQCFRRPERNGGGYVMIPEQNGERIEIAEDIFALHKVPYKHFISTIQPKVGISELLAIHDRLLTKAKDAVKDVPGRPSYNVIFVHEWIMVVPRTHAGRNNVNANASGMVGMISLASDLEREAWKDMGIVKHLAYLGVPARSS